MAPYLVPDAARILRATYPRLTVAWLEEKTAALAAALAAGTLDATILALPVPPSAGDVACGALTRWRAIPSLTEAISRPCVHACLIS